MQSANGNGNRIPVNGFPFNGVLFPFVSVKKNLPTSVNSVTVKEFWGGPLIPLIDKKNFESSISVHFR